MKNENEIIEDAKNALIEMYEDLEEYGKLRIALSSIEHKMAKRYNTINFALNHFKKGAGNGK